MRWSSSRAPSGRVVGLGAREHEPARARSRAGLEDRERRAESGTRWSWPAFMRSPGMVQTPSRSISDQRAPRTSPDRAAVRMANSSARALMPPCARSSAGMPAPCRKHRGVVRLLEFLRFAQDVGRDGRASGQGSRRARRSARAPWRLSSTCSIRPRSRSAVVRFVSQIGSSTPSTSSVVILSTGMCARGAASFISVVCHC